MYPCVAFVSLFIAIWAAPAAWAKTEAEILQEIFARPGFATTKPPGEGPNGTTEVQFGVTPIWLELSPKGVIKGKMWYKYMWTDERLTWDADQAKGLSSLKVNPTQIWMPDIFPYNRFASYHSMFSYLSDGSASNALIMTTGSIIFVPETAEEFICSDVNLDDFWGDQECYFKFGSWTYDGNLLNIVPFEGKTELDLDEYDKSSPLLIKKNSIERVVKYYPCCADEPYPHLLMSLTVQRKFYVQDNGVVIHNPRLKSTTDSCA
ncbi:hypothetical protein TCAL_11776 [Tigriopus californicus]|uniref:Neurotransmitter-gated ion-channel ligand-binding domain-containing protein n=1 Tax=Tigriopus californicus TaxID=6832 RepID=A0A553PGW8_TIGCA|nr:acetylcholine receptor subunit alpha-like 2 [Tigriopus californicus]TRY76906.1 hypothetical protein TCAL_11776 [Tigriopus californicus]